jgi:hypothetical protein
MRDQSADQVTGETGLPIVRDGQYVAIGCCRLLMNLQGGEPFPPCPVHGETTWGWIPSDANAEWVSWASDA